MRREISEELHIIPDNIISVSFLHTTNTSVLYVPHVMDIFLVQVKNVDIKTSWEISSYVWVTFEQLKQTLDKDSLFGIEKLSYLVS